MGRLRMADLFERMHVCQRGRMYERQDHESEH